MQAIHHHHTVKILRGIVLYIFCFKINTLLCYTVVLVLVLGIGIARGQYYWILGALFGIVLTLAIFPPTASAISLFAHTIEGVQDKSP